MKRVVIVLVLMCIMLVSFGCAGSSGSSSSKEENITKEENPTITDVLKLTRIELSANKTEIIADNTDVVVFTANTYDQNNNTIGTNVIFYQNNNEMLYPYFKSSEPGIYKFTARYNNIRSNEISIKVNPKIVQVATISSISIISLPKKTKYYLNDELDISGIILEATYDNATKKIETITKGAITGFDSSTAGTKTLTITVSGKTATYQVTINAVTLTSIEIKTAATKTNYYIGEILDISGLVIEGTYSNGTKKIETVTSGSITGFDSSVIGTKTLNASFEGKTITFDITVVEKPVLKRIELSFDKLEIIADDIDSTVITMQGYDQNNEKIDVNINLYKNGNLTNNAPFKTLTEGNYKFVAKSGEITSNEITISASIKLLLNTQEITEYLKNNFNECQTSFGKTNFTFYVSENTTITMPHDYDIWVKYNFSFFYDIEYSNKITTETNHLVCNELKSFQEKLAKDIIKRTKNKKIKGRYIYTWYTYEYIKEGFNSRQYYSWANYTPDSILTKYDDAKITGFKWTPTLDDVLTR